MNTGFKQLTLAREYRGYSQSELSKNITGLSQSNLSKYEKGLGGLAEDLIEKIMKFLDFPVEFLNAKITNVLEFAHFRKKSTITKKVRLKFETNIKILGYIVDKLSESIEWPEFTFIPLNIDDGYTPEYIARYTRKILKIDSSEPITDIFGLLERNGIIVIQYDAESEKFDGVSFVSDTGQPIIVINKNFSNDRKRRTLVHELGHLIMHIVGQWPISSNRDPELETAKFTSEFLMPEDAIRNSLYNLRISILGNLKQYWLVSMQSIIRRAKDLGCISYDKYKYLNIEFSRNGWRKNEPFNVTIDKPNLFDAAYLLHRNQLDFNDIELAKAFLLPLDITKKAFNQKNNKLRIVLD